MKSYIRYSFERYGVTYVAAIYCLDTRPREKNSDMPTGRPRDGTLSAHAQARGWHACRPRSPTEAVRAGPPKETSKDFTYFSPGLIIPNTGLRKDTGGRADYTVYARLRFPLKEAPAFANSQSFNNWGDCDFTGRSVRSPRQERPALFMQRQRKTVGFQRERSRQLLLSMAR